MKKKNFAMLLLIVLGLFASTLSVAVATPKAAQQTQITLWYTENPTETVTLEKKIDEFHALYPDYNVTLAAQDFWTIGNDYRAAYSSGTEGDVIRTPRDDVPWFASEGLIHPLTADVAQADLDDFIDSALDRCYYDGTLYALPQAVDCPIVFYNDQLLTDAGIDTTPLTWDNSLTWTEWWDLLMAANVTTDVHAFSFPGAFYGQQFMYYMMGGYFFEGDTYEIDDIAIGNKANQRAIEAIKNMTDSTVTPPWAEQGWGNFDADFGAGDVAIIMGGPWLIGGFHENSEWFNGTLHGPENLGMMLLPHDDTFDNYGTLIGGNFYTVSSHTSGDVKTGSVLLTKYLSGHDAMALAAIENAHAPARLSVMSNASVMAADTYGNVSIFFEQCKLAYSITPHELYGRCEGILGNELNEYLSGSQDFASLSTEVRNQWIELIGVPEEPEPEPETGIPGFALPTLAFACFIGIVVISKKFKK